MGRWGGVFRHGMGGSRLAGHGSGGSGTMARIVEHLSVQELEARYRAARDVILTPGDQFGMIGLGHQWKSVCGPIVAASSRRQRSATTASRSASVAKCRLPTGSSTN